MPPSHSSPTDWEAAYHRVKREYEVMPRVGLHVGHRLLALWHRTEDWPVWIAAWVEPVIAWLACAVHNHTPFTDMDNHTIVCAVCTKRLGNHV